VRRTLRVVAVLLALVCIAVWFALGANRGWTKTTRTRMEKDPVADDMVYPVTERYFSPGVEALGVGLLLSAALAGVSFAFKRKLKY
jgi:hypothetical protein